MLVDMHVHCYELGDLAKYIGKVKLVCVSDDPVSSQATLKLQEKYKEVEACVGVHPWVAHEYGTNAIKTMLNEVIGKDSVKCLGEVGLDKKFKPNTFEKQLEVFAIFVEYAKEYDLVLNIHAADAWREVLEILKTNDVSRAYFHWYTGPIDVLEEIQNEGYFIGANPAWIIQNKHRRVLEIVNLNHVITESDAPYNYRGLEMTPDMVENTVKFLARTRNISVSYVEEIVYRNYQALFK